MPEITESDRREAEDMGFGLCEECGATYIHAPGYVNDGHQCDEDGLQPKFAIRD